jgi:hypothetical protein
MSVRRGRTQIRRDDDGNDGIIQTPETKRSKSVSKSQVERNSKNELSRRSNSKARNQNVNNDSVIDTPHSSQVKQTKTPVTKTRNKSKSKGSSDTIDVPNAQNPQDENNTNDIYQVITLVLSVINISRVMQFILFLAKSFASLSPWMFTFEMTDELNLTFYVAEDESQESEIEDSLYEQLRIQPTAFGYYLRASLWAGYGTMIFNTWSLFSLPKLNLFNNAIDTFSSDAANTTANIIESQQEMFIQYVAVLIHLYLLTQLILNLLLITPRIVIHLQCWSCTNLQDNSLEESLDALRNMLRSDVWIAGRLLSRVQDGVTVLYLLVFQAILSYLKVSENNIRIYDTLVSLSATGVFMVVLRVTVATLYSISCRDPAVLAEARSRGLTAMDIDFMKTFDYSPPAPTPAATVTSSTPKRTRSSKVRHLDSVHECSICLLGYEKGDKLVVLPCNKNHIFHYDCAVHWLRKQNACPLCQQLV